VGLGGRSYATRDSRPGVLPVTFVVTNGPSSLDLYSGRLADRLPVSLLYTDVYVQVRTLESAPILSEATAKAAMACLRFARVLREVEGIVHLPSQHLARFGGLLSGPYIVTVHDVIRYLDMTNRRPLIHLPGPRERLLLGLDSRGIRSAARIIAVSEWTKRELIRTLGLPADRIRVVHHGVDSSFSPGATDPPFPRPYLLYVGSEQPRKNLQFLLQVFKRLRQDFPRLLLVKVGRAGGRETDFRAQTVAAIRALGLEDDVIVYDHVSNEDLLRFYRNAEVFCFPSLYEGFGWPPLEAMACGCPVVASTSAAIPEVLGDAGVLCEPDDERKWVEVVGNLLQSRPLRSELRERGLARAAQFSWDRARHQVLGVYGELWQAAGNGPA
jgi:glycosyltransferase involved in cell wall biosynthesis